MTITKQNPTLDITRTFNGLPRALVAPQVIGAIYDEDHQGLVPLSFLSRPLRVEFPAWIDVRTGDTYQLIWNDLQVGPVKDITTEQAGDPLFLEVETQLLRQEGVYTVAYLIIEAENGTPGTSEPVRVEIDLTPPGRPQLGPIKFPEEIEDGLTSDELTALGDELIAEIGSYTDMYQRDVIKTYWGNVEGPGAVVTRTDMGLDRVLVTYPRTFLESLEDFDGFVTYTVTDRAGNLSSPSIGTHVQLLLNEAPNDFPAPVIDPSVGSLVDYAEARSGITVDIPNYPDVAAFDQVTLYWENIPSAPQFVPEGNEAAPVVMSFNVPYPTVAVKPEGIARVTYEVKRNGQPLGTSLGASIDVFVSLPGPSQLDAPTIQGSSVSNPNIEDNFIDEDDYELNSRAIIKWKTGFALSDEVNLHWGNESIPQWYQIKASDISAQRDLILPIPNETMKAQGAGAQIPVLYSLTRLGNPNANSSPSQDVVVRSREEMPGGVDGLEGPAFVTDGSGIVSPIGNENGAPVTISPYLNIREGQTLEFTFKAFDDSNNPIPEADFSGNRTLDRNDVINGYVFTIPLAIMKRICIGFAEAYFKVVPAAGSNQSPATSRITRVRVVMRRPGQSCDWQPASAD